MASQVEISNAAIIAVGGDIISSLNELTPEAVAINAVWNQVRKATLRSNNWKFAIKRQELAQSSTNPVYEYSYRYALPSDSLRILQVYADSDYKIERGFIITNSETCKVKYVSDVVDVNEWSSDFADAMSSRLAADIAYTITKDINVSRMQMSIFAGKIEAAKWIDGSEDIVDDFQFPSDLITARFT